MTRLWVVSPENWSPFKFDLLDILPGIYHQKTPEVMELMPSVWLQQRSGRVPCFSKREWTCQFNSNFDEFPREDIIDVGYFPPPVPDRRYRFPQDTPSLSQPSLFSQPLFLLSQTIRFPLFCPEYFDSTLRRGLKKFDFQGDIVKPSPIVLRDRFSPAKRPGLKESFA
jgi:hypothetical protein